MFSVAVKFVATVTVTSSIRGAKIIFAAPYYIFKLHSPVDALL